MSGDKRLHGRHNRDDFYRDEDFDTRDMPDEKSMFNDPVYDHLMERTPTQYEIDLANRSMDSAQKSSGYKKVEHGSSGSNYTLIPTTIFPDKTSITHPIEVNTLRIEGYAGVLGRTFCPGKKNRTGRNGPWYRDLNADLLRLRMEFQIDVLVCLIEPSEFEYAKVPDLLWKAQEYQIKPVWYPIPDTRVPTDIQSFIRLIEKLVASFKRGRKLAVHCMGGIGRTGLVNAAICIALGYTPDDAIKLARQMHAKALENTTQEEWIKHVFPMAWKYYRPTQKRDQRRDNVAPR